MKINHSMSLHIFWSASSWCETRQRVVSSYGVNVQYTIRTIRWKPYTSIKHYPSMPAKRRNRVSRGIYVPASVPRHEGVEQCKSSQSHGCNARLWHWNGCGGRWKIGWRQTARGVVSVRESVRRRVSAQPRTLIACLDSDGALAIHTTPNT